MFLRLIQVVIDDLTFNKIPVIENVFETITSNKEQENLKNSVNVYDQYMEQFMKEPISFETLSEIDQQATDLAAKVYFKDIPSALADSTKLFTTLTERKTEYITKQNELSREYCTLLIKSLYSKIVKPIIKNLLSDNLTTSSKSTENLNQGIESFKKEYGKQSKGLLSVSVLKSFCEQHVTKDFENLSKIEEISEHVKQMKSLLNEQLVDLTESERRLVSLQNEYSQNSNYNEMLQKHTLLQTQLFKEMIQAQKESQLSSQACIEQLSKSMHDSQQQTLQLYTSMQVSQQQAQSQQLAVIIEHNKQMSSQLNNALVQTTQAIMQNNANNGDSVWGNLAKVGLVVGLGAISPVLSTIPYVGGVLSSTAAGMSTALGSNIFGNSFTQQPLNYDNVNSQQQSNVLQSQQPITQYIQGFVNSIPSQLNQGAQNRNPIQTVNQPLPSKPSNNHQKVPIQNRSQITDTSKFDIGGNVKKTYIQGSYTNTTSGDKFPYGCQWGCNRENVCSQPGNSCGRPSCNDARSKQSLGGGHFKLFASNK